jgi:hypothetical protein
VSASVSSTHHGIFGYTYLETFAPDLYVKYKNDYIHDVETNKPVLIILDTKSLNDTFPNDFVADVAKTSYQEIYKNDTANCVIYKRVE